MSHSFAFGWESDFHHFSNHLRALPKPGILLIRKGLAGGWSFGEEQLRIYAQTSKYVPPGSDLKELFEIVRTLLPEAGPSSAVMDLPNKRSRRKEFLNNCDQRIVAVLGGGKNYDVRYAGHYHASGWQKRRPVDLSRPVEGVVPRVT